jgi:hypothetical protein
MPKPARTFADALARLMFRKPLEALDTTERARLDFLRALDADARDEERYEDLAAEFPDEGCKTTLH